MTKSKEEIKEQQRKYKEAHKEEIREYQKRYREEHKEEIAENRRLHADRQKNYYREHKKEYMERLKKSQHKINAMRVRRTVDDGVVTLTLKIPLMLVEEEKALRQEIRSAIRPLLKVGTSIIIVEGRSGTVMYKEQEDKEIVAEVERIISSLYERN